MRIAVTGSSGFVGKRLVKKLKNSGNEVIELDIVNGYDVSNFSSIKETPEFDVLYHLAAKSFVPDSWKEPQSFYNVNVNAVINTLELCRRNKAKYVYTSSYVYGVPKYLPIDEKHPLTVFNPYCGTKIIGEEISKNYCSLFGIPVIIVRPFNIYGPGQNENFLISKIFNEVLTGNVRLMDPEPKRDYLYVEDMVEMYASLLNFNKEGYEIFNAGAGESFSVREIVNYITGFFPNKIAVEYSNEKRPNEIADTVSDIQKAFNLLGWKPKYDLQTGLSEIYNTLKK